MRTARLPKVNSTLISLISIVAINILIRAHFFSWPLISDEGGYAYTATWWFRGLTLYSDQLWFDRPQGIFLVYKLGMALLGETTWAIRLWAAIWVATTTIIVYLITRHLSNNKIALAAAMIFAVFSSLPQIEGFTANAETFALLPATLCAYFAITKRSGLAGLFASMAFLVKPSAGSVALLAGIWMIYDRDSIKSLIVFSISAIPLTTVAILHGVLTVGLNDYLFAVVFFRLGLDVGSPIQNFSYGCIKTAVVWIPLLVFSIGNTRLDRKVVFINLWIVTSILGMGLGGNWFRHYFIQIIPPLTVGAAFGLEQILSRFGRFIRWSLALVLALPVLVSTPYFLLSPKTGSWMLYHRPGYQITDQAAHYIQYHTSESDLIYVAFAEADLYHLSDRRSAIPYLYRYELLHLPGAYERVVKAIEQAVPVYVLALDTPYESVDMEGRFWKALEKNYEVETTFGDVYLYRKKE